ncbi:MAG: HAD-IA family hydrolase [Acidobacteriota bacterium]
MFDVLLFDLGGVLVHFAGFEELCKLLPAGSDPAAVRERWIRSESVHRFEQGALDADTFAKRFLAEWKLELEPEAFLGAFTEWNRGLYPGAHALLERLAKSHRMACLSNANDLHTPTHRQRLAPFFERFYFSNELRLAKPSPEIFTWVLSDLAVPAPRIAYFDDTALNVEAAARAGMSAYRTDGFAELERCLTGLGLLP